MNKIEDKNEAKLVTNNPTNATTIKLIKDVCRMMLLPLKFRGSLISVPNATRKGPGMSTKIGQKRSS